MRKLYIEDPTTLSGTILDGLKDDVLRAINRSYQVMWTAPNDHFRRGEYTFNTVSGTQEYLLDSTIQQILGVVKVNGSAPYVSPIKDRADFDNYGTRFLNQLTNTISNARPAAYFLEAFGVDAAESSQVSMFFVPTPDDAYAITFEASSEAPSLTETTLDAETDLRVPDQYVESILLPLSMFFVTDSHYFLIDQRQGEFQKANGEFGLAMAQLGFTDPQIEQFRKTVTAPTNG